MATLKLEYAQVSGFPYIKFAGDLSVDNFAALHLVVKGATKFATIPVIVDFSGDVHISDAVTEVKCWRYPPTVPDYARRVVLLVISPLERLAEIEALLTPHELQHAASLDEAIETLTKNQSKRIGT
ncbi:MAG: hypothetical protein ACYC56_10395 [Candidatus Aquicultor sp.]